MSKILNPWLRAAGQGGCAVGQIGEFFSGDLAVHALYYAFGCLID